MEPIHIDEKGYKSLAYDKLTALLIEAVKELKAENTALKADVEVLKQEVGVLGK